MPRRRVAVALIPPPDVARSVQVLRTALGDPRLDELPPHLTLVPPINLGDDGLRDTRALLREVAERTAVFELRLGPAGTFAPATPTLHLEVDGDTRSLAALRAAVRTGPLERPDVWPFHPHVTLREELAEPPPALAAQVLSAVVGTWSVDRLHLLEQRRSEHGRPHWVPIVEEPFGPPVVVGRGGIELELRCTAMVSEMAGAGPPTSELAVVGSTGDDGSGVPCAEWSPMDPFAHGLVVSASAPRAQPADAPLGVVQGSLVGLGRPDRGGVAVLQRLEVEAGSRRLGIGRQLLRRWCHEAATAGAGVVLVECSSAADDPASDRVGAAALLDGEGFVEVGTTHVRQLVGD